MTAGFRGATIHISPILPAQRPSPVSQGRQVSLEVASRVGISDVLSGPNVAETIFPILGSHHNRVLRRANAIMIMVSSCYFRTVVVL